MPSSDVTVIRAADWVVAWDSDRADHVYLEGADVAWRGGALVQVGGRYQGPVTRELSGRGRMVMPGLVDIHAHTGDELLAKGLFDDTGSPGLWGQALYQFSTLLDADAEAVAACTELTLASLACSGVTTVVDIGGPWDGWLDRLAASGLRAYAAPSFRQARWDASSGHRLDYLWDVDGGRARFEAALRVVDDARAHPCGRLDALLAPAQVDTCDEALLRDAHAEARRRGIGLTIHAAQTMAEHEELMRRHGLTAPAWLDRIGVLDERVILGHAIFLDHHRWTRLRTANDLARLAERGTSVAHCPTTFARSGMTLESLGGYRRAGVNVGLGTDSYPFDMIAEMRDALVCARIAAGDVFDCGVGDVFRAATVAGARALGRDDIGRLAAGARADLVVVDLEHPAMGPVHDPLRSLVLTAGERAVRDVFVDGAQIVADGRMLAFDRAEAAARVAAGQRRAVAHLASATGAHGDATIDHIAPRCLALGGPR